MYVSEFLQKVKEKKKFSKNFRLYIIDKNKHHFIHNGILKEGFDVKLEITKDRENVLSAFSKMVFLFDEIIRLRIVGYSDERENQELLYLANLIPANRKIRTFLDWKVFEPEFTRDMSRLFEVRNDTLHCISLDEVNYVPKNKITLSNDSGFNKFASDIQTAWKTLLKIYAKEQNKADFEKLSKLL